MPVGVAWLLAGLLILGGKVIRYCLALLYCYCDVAALATQPCRRSVRRDTCTNFVSCVCTGGSSSGTSKQRCLIDDPGCDLPFYYNTIPCSGMLSIPFPILCCSFVIALTLFITTQAPGAHGLAGRAAHHVTHRPYSPAQEHAYSKGPTPAAQRCH